MKKILLFSTLMFMSGCTIQVRSEMKKDQNEVIIEKEIFVGPKIGKG